VLRAASLLSAERRARARMDRVRTQNSTDGVRCHRVCKPGDVLTLTLKPKRVKEPLAVYTGSIRVGQEKAITAEDITLTFGIVDAPPAPTPVPTPAAEPAAPSAPTPAA
jgi:3-hydroxyacyl-[acyl-carrier-protein] dehydratase